MNQPQPSPSLISQGFSSRVVMPECNGVGLPLVIGEAPGKSEDESGIPFHPEAEAGGLFKRLMSRVGIERTRFNIANVVMQRPPYNELYDAKGYPMAYTHEAIEYWKPFLHATIEQLQPPVIIGLGRTALETLTGFTDIGTTRGYVNEARIDIYKPDEADWDKMYDRRSLHIPTICTYHPAFLNYGQRHLSGVFIRDVLAALEIGEKGWEAPSLKVTPSPSPEAFRAFCEAFQPSFHKLTADIETPDTRGADESELEVDKQTPIDRMSFCYATEVGGYSVPFEEPFLTMARELIARAQVLRGWNWRLFDWPRLVQNGFTTQAREEDLIDAWRHLHRTLPASVAFVAPFFVNMAPWKHEAHTQPEYYSCLHKDQYVVLANGEHKPISEIVRNRLCVELLGMDEEGHAIPVQVIDWHRSPDTHDWLRIRTRQKASLSCTSDHKVWTRHGWKQAHTLRVGDEVVLPRHGSDSVIHGKLLGDSYVSPKNSLALCHSPKQMAWLTRCAYHFGAPAPKEQVPNRWGYRTWRTAAQIQRKWRKLFYPQGKRIFVAPPDDKALAVWYCDNGNLHNTHRPWTSQSAKFAIELSASVDAAAWLRKEFGEANVCYRLHKTKKAGYCTVNRVAKSVIFNRMAPFIPPEMYYKLPEPYRGRYNGWMEVREFQWDAIESIRLRLTRSSRYCVTVDHPTHRFFTRGGLVKNCMDAIVTHLIGEGIEREMRASGQWDTYQQHVVEIISTNHGVCTQMARNGLPIDPVKIEAFKLELEAKHAKRLARLQELVPEALKPVKQKSGLKKVPKSLEGCIRRPFSVKASTLTKEERASLNGSYGDLEASPETVVSIGRWAFLLIFNPASHLQVKALIRHFGHKAKTDRKTKNETSSDDTLKSLVTKYVESKKASDMEAVESYRLIRECRAIDKVLGTYVKGWKPASDGLIHATPGIWGDMFRVSWRRPNLTATIADKKEMQIASGFRKCICVAADEVLIEADWKSQEAVLLAHYANDPDYMRLALLGLNAYMASHLLGRPADLSWSDEALGGYLADIKHDKRNVKIYDDAKHTIYLVQNGGTPFLISELYEVTRARAQYLYNFYFDLFPKIKRFQQQTLQKAHDECKLVNAWGYKMPFWSVFQWQQKRYERLRQLWVRYKTDPKAMFTKKDREVVDAIALKIGTGVEADATIASMCYDLGDEAKGSLSFFPRDSGAAMLKDAMLAMENEYRLASRGILRGCIHDATLSICKHKEVDEVAEIMRLTMERPLKQLDGLVIPVEIAIGQSWDKASMKEWKAIHVMSA